VPHDLLLVQLSRSVRCGAGTPHPAGGQLAWTLCRIGRPACRLLHSPGMAVRPNCAITRGR